MRFIESRLFAAISLLSLATEILLASPLTAATHPRYGGTLRVEVHAASVSIDPREWQAGSLESGGISDSRSGTKSEIGRHAGPFEAGGKMKIGIWFCHVRLFFWRGG